MIQRQPRIVRIVTASLALALSGAVAGAAEPSAADLAEQIRQLQAKVEQLQKQQEAQIKASSAEVNATIERVLRDADQRSQMLDVIPFAGNWQAGKFMLQSEDGKFLMHPWFQLQFRYAANYRDAAAGAGAGSDTESGFELRRLKFGADGHVFSPDVTYLINWATNRNSGGLELEEAWVRGKLSEDWSIRGGQLKDPFAHESLISSKKFMAADRTILTDLFTGGDNFVQGVALGYQRDALQTEFAFTDGTNEANRNFQDFPTNAWDFGVAGRVQYKLFGDWGNYEQFTSLNNKKDLMVIGGGVDLSEGGDTDQILHTADVQYNQTGGLGLFGAYYGRYTTNAPKGAGAAAPAAAGDTYDWGLIAQASYLIPQTKFEPFVRYDLISFDAASVPAGAEDSVHEITVGTNYYLHNHDAKFTLDVGYLPNGAPISDSGADILASDAAEFLLRAQFQLLL